MTPFESELRAEPQVTQPPVHRRRRPWRRERRPPQTWRRAILLGLARLGLGFAVGAAVALLLARLLDRSAPIGFYAVGALVLLSGLIGAQAARERAPYEYADSGEIVRVKPGITLAAVGVLLVLAGAILETV